MQRYLILLQSEEDYPEQLNSYMFLIMQVIDLAKKMNMTFVLPKIEVQPRNSFLAEKGEKDLGKIILGKTQVGMDEFFDRDYLNNYIPTVTQDEFLKISNQKIEFLACFNNLHKNTIRSFGTNFDIQDSGLLENINQLNIIKANVIGITGLVRGRNGIEINPNWHNKKTLDYWGIRKSLVHNKKLLREAELFIKKNLPENYVAIHWRRSDRNFYGGFESDFPENKDGMKRELQRLVNLLKKRMNQYGTKKVFMATDCGTQWHLDFLDKQLDIVRYNPSKNWEKYQHDSIVEQIICSKADHFIAAPHNYTSCSSFSRWIIDERILNNLSKHNSYRKVNNNRIFKKISGLRINFCSTKRD